MLEINKECIGEITWIRFRSSKKINWRQQSVTPNWRPSHYLPHACWGNKSTCPIHIHITYNFQSHPRTIISINERWSNQCKQTSQKSTTLISKLKLKRTILLNLMSGENYPKEVTFKNKSWNLITWKLERKDFKIKIISLKV